MRTPHPVGQIDGRTLFRATLEEGDTSVTLLSLGAITQDWRVPHQGARLPVVLGYADPLAYARNPAYLGVIAGRIANRIGSACFPHGKHIVNLPANDGPHHLHGGPLGLSTQMWEMEADTAGNTLRLRYHSPDGEGGYPAAVDFEVLVRLNGHRLTYDMRATPDRETPINLAQHNYYNLAGHGDIRTHSVQINAPQFTPTDADLIPTGQIAPVAGTRNDFTAPHLVAQQDPDGKGHDINMVLAPSQGAPAARVIAPNGLKLRMWTDQPGLQFYTGAGLPTAPGAHPGQTLAPFAGLCLEPQGFPDALNKPAFPSILCSPDAPYAQRLEVEISP